MWLQSFNRIGSAGIKGVVTIIQQRVIYNLLSKTNYGRPKYTLFLPGKDLL